MRSSLLLRLIALVAIASISARASGPVFPTIGDDRPPFDEEPICPIPYVGETYDSSGPMTGSLLPDFTLHTTAGEPVSLASLLARGRPVLLVGGSISCPVFRATIPTLNDLADRYRGRLEILIVYVVEAHPVVDASPFFGVENVTTQNRYADILVRQPTTYGERRALVDSLLGRLAITPRIVIDGPCNEWWNVSGRASNHAVLLRSDGRVVAWHGWFKREPHDMPGEVERLLDGVSAISDHPHDAAARPRELRLD